MFGIFNKKEESNESLNNPDFLALVAKWDAFLGKIDTRFLDSMQSAEEAILDNLVESNYDIQATSLAWQGIKAQLREFSTKIENTFELTVKPQMEVFVKHFDLINEDQKGEHLKESIYLRIERFELILKGKVAETYYDYAIKDLLEPLQCTQCSATIEVKKDIFRSHYISCNYCNAVNTFTPNDKVAMIAQVVRDLACYRSLKEWDESQTALAQYNDLPNRADANETALAKSIAAFKIREDKERAYWNKFFQEKYKITSENEGQFEHDVEVKMKYIYEERKRIFNF